MKITKFFWSSFSIVAAVVTISALGWECVAQAVDAEIDKVASPVSGNEGAGGFGIKVLSDQGEKVYLLDLVEHGVEEAPFINRDIVQSMPQYETLKGRVYKKIARIVDEEVAEVLTIKLAEISRVLPVLSFALLGVLEQLEWAIVNMPLEKLVGVPSPIKITEDSVLIANRLNRTVRINRKNFNLMDHSHKAALILHEIVSPLLVVRKTEELGSHQNWVVGRDLVGYVFTPYEDAQELNKRLGKLEPELIFYRDLLMDKPCFECIHNQIDAYELQLDKNDPNSFSIIHGVGFRPRFKVDSKKKISRLFRFIKSLSPFSGSNSTEYSQGRYADELCEIAQIMTKTETINLDLVSRKSKHVWGTYLSEKWGEIAYLSDDVNPSYFVYYTTSYDYLHTVKEKAVTDYNASTCKSQPLYLEELLLKVVNDWAMPKFKQSLFAYTE